MLSFFKKSMGYFNIEQRVYTMGCITAHLLAFSLGVNPIYYWITAGLANLNVILSRRLGIQLMLKIAGIENVNQIIIQSAGSPNLTV